MKIMKYTIALVIVIIIAAVIFQYLKNQEMKTIQHLWDQLKTSENTEVEAKNINELKYWISKKGGFYEVNAILTSGDTVNLAQMKEKVSEIKSVSITFSWNDKTFTGSDWTPNDTNNAYNFFLE